MPSACTRSRAGARPKNGCSTSSARVEHTWIETANGQRHGGPARRTARRRPASRRGGRRRPPGAQRHLRRDALQHERLHLRQPGAVRQQLAHAALSPALWKRQGADTRSARQLGGGALRGGGRHPRRPAPRVAAQAARPGRASCGRRARGHGRGRRDEAAAAGQRRLAAPPPPRRDLRSRVLLRRRLCRCPSSRSRTSRTSRSRAMFHRLLQRRRST